ncbi:UNVERIFIED_CONTAM: hypothetical protein PYX00_001135 [Menopon gallinae]|uniref:DUF1308 domain-containing protein n=1 Tax=Menopon gallinae TaxID=328185 RepID=A0AAW2IBR6_9NEOP
MDKSELVEARISEASEILKRLSLINIDGASKLKNKINQEISFLKKCLINNTLKDEHLICSNLTHLEAVAVQLFNFENVCVGIMSNKVLNTGNQRKKICVDLILYGGSVWMKVIARNRKALTLVSNGDCSFGQKSIIDQALEFMECSKQHIYYFKPPTVIFYFANGIENFLADNLRRIGIKVEEKLDSPDLKYASSSLCRQEENLKKMSVKDIKMIQNVNLIKEISVKRLNLGVTTLIAYVSALTNGGCHNDFQSEILKKHAEWERARPVKPILDKVFAGKELYCCETAVKNFKDILDVLGGKGECERGRELLERIIVIEDHPTTKLKAGGKIKERSLAIFGTGEYLKAITVTANHSFIRSALNKGVYFEVFLHESRALTEGKELPA